VSAVATPTAEQWHLRAVAPPPARVRRVRRRPDRWWIARVSLVLAGVAVGVVALRATDLSAIGPYGLIQALPPAYYAGVALVLAAFPLTWCARRTSRLEFPLELVALVVLMHGAPAIAEPLPRFPSAWLLSGFTSYVADTGRVLPLVDARFSWPSMLAGAAMLTNAGGLPSTQLLLKWWPVALNLAYLVPIYLLAQRLVADTKRAMLMTWLFPLANWVGQDYFSPQSIAFLLYLMVMLVALVPFGIRPRVYRRAGDARSRPRLSRKEAVTLLVGLLVVTVALATGHQLTPAFATVTLVALAIARRTTLRVFGVLMLTISLGWLCYGAYAFWAGHITKVFGELGRLQQNVVEGGTGRLAGSAAHVFVTRERLAVAVLILGLAAAGFFVSRRVRADRLAAAVLTVAPALILTFQSYGGEGGMRVFLVALPGALALVALLLTAFPRPVSYTGAYVPFRPEPVHGAIAFVLTLALVPMFLVARWGNEEFEQTRPNELAAVQSLYSMAPPGSTLMALDLHVPWMFDHVDTYKYKTRTFAELPSTDATAILQDFGTSNGYLIVTTGQIDFGIETFGLAPDWASDLEATLTSTGRFDLVYQNPDARIYRYTPAPAA
jgi:hypothetical protein